MQTSMINIGYGNAVCTDKIVAIVAPDSAPVKRLVSEARERGDLIDATCGRRTRAVIVMESRHVLLSAIQPETITSRMNEALSHE